MSVLDEAKKLCKEYQNDKLAVVASVSPHYERLKSDAFGLLYPSYGGMPLGRIITYAGLQSSGKTTAAAKVVSDYQRAFPDKTCVYYDLEHTFDKVFQSRMTGIQLDKLVLMDDTACMTGEQILDSVLRFQQQDDIGAIVIDSIPALLPAAVLENDMEKDSGMRGTIAKKLYPFLGVMNSLLREKQNILILVNQVRIAGTTFTGAPIYKEPGGAAPDYYSSIKLRFGTRKFIKGDKNDSTDGEGADGFRLNYVFTKNKCSPIARGGGFMSFNYSTGFMWLDDLFEIATKFDFIHRLNNVTYQLINLETGEIYKDETGKDLQGKKKDLEEYIKTNIPFQTKYIEMLTNYIQDHATTYGDILDARDKEEIKEQEESIETGGRSKKKKDKEDAIN